MKLLVFEKGNYLLSSWFNYVLHPDAKSVRNTWPLHLLPPPAACQACWASIETAERLWFDEQQKRKKQQQLNWYPPAFFISMKSLILVSCPVINQNKRKTKILYSCFTLTDLDLPSWGFFVLGNCYLATTSPGSCQTPNTESMTYRKEARRKRVGWGLLQSELI